ncbi:MAG: Wzz/FepE/Etk N-terminal domain-containing protein [Pseudomonadota bacterium]
MEQAQAIREIVGMARRRIGILIGVAIFGVIASGFTAYILPPVYQSSARILVESQKIPAALARSTVTASAAERVQLIKQRLMTRDNLVQVIEDLGLFLDREDLSVSEQIEILRDATVIRPIAVSRKRARRGNNRRISAFVIRVSFNNPGQAAKIANEFVTTVLDQNLRARTERASETLDFFQQEEDRLSTQLASIESEITQFKQDNAGALPESLDFRRSEIARLANSDLQLDRRILELEEERGGLEERLEKISEGSGPPPDSNKGRQLQKMENLLVQKLAIFSENHRDVRRLRAQIEALQAESAVEEPSADPAEARSARKGEVERRIALLDTQITLLNDQKGEIEKKRKRYEESIQRTPNIEMALRGYYRKHDDTQDQLKEIVRKRASAETGERLEVNQQAERFEVIENATAPEKPVSPNRRKILALGSGVSLGLAVALAFLVELMNPAIRTAAQMERQLDLRPVATIPYILTAAERRRRRFWTVTLAIIVLAGFPLLLYGVDQHYLPLELMGQRVAERTGLDEVIRMIEARF